MSGFRLTRNFFSSNTSITPIVFSSSPPRLSTSTSFSRSFTSTPSLGPPLRKKITIVDFRNLYLQKKPLTCVTAYSYPSAVHVDSAGIDCLLVGDSVGMVELGYDTTLPVSMEEMLHHAKAVSRGATIPLLVADMPFGSYEQSPQQAYNNAIRFLKESGMDCVKLEGGVSRAATVSHLVKGGISVMGHIGLTPQAISVLGGFRAQGKTLAAAESLLEDALALQSAGAFSLVIECVPAEVARIITEELHIPTIGIGAGPYTSGQVLVYHDLLGFFQHAHHAKVTPSFSKSYAHVGQEIQKGLETYKKEVESREFPGLQYSPFKMKNGEEEEWKKWREEKKKLLKKQNEKEKIISNTKKVGSDGQDGAINVY